MFELFKPHKLFQSLIFPHRFVQLNFWGAVAGAAISYLGAKESADASEAAMAQQGRAADRQAEVAERQQDIADEQWERFKEVFAPLEDEIVASAMEEPDYAKAEGRATADVQGAFARSEEATARAAGRYGLDPSSGRYDEMRRVNALDRTKTEVQQRNLAREQEDDKAWARKVAASSLGRGLPADARAGLSAAGRTYGDQAGMYGRQAQDFASQAGSGMQAAGYWTGRAIDSWGDNNSTPDSPDSYYTPPDQDTGELGW